MTLLLLYNKESTKIEVSMQKFKAVFLLVIGKLNKSVSVEEAHKLIDELDKNHDGKLSIADVILLLIEKAK